MINPGSNAEVLTRWLCPSPGAALSSNGAEVDFHYGSTTPQGLHTVVAEWDESFALLTIAFRDVLDPLRFIAWWDALELGDG